MKSLISAITLSAIAVQTTIAQDWRQTTASQAWEIFANPDDSARTKGWWFSGETETTRRGITLDMEAIKDAGLGGIVYYNQVHGEGDGSSEVFSPWWWDALKFSAQEAKRVGLTYEVALSNGYVAGGRWITPEYSMQRLEASTQYIVGDGIHTQRIQIAAPDKTICDIAVIAFPVDEEHGCKHILVTDTTITGNTYMTFDMGRPVTARSISYRTSARGKSQTTAMNYPADPGDAFTGYGYVELPAIGQLEASDDGIVYHAVCDLRPRYRSVDRLSTITTSFPTTTARYYRLHIHDWWLSNTDFTPAQGQGDIAQMTRPGRFNVSNVVLSADAMLDRWEAATAGNSDFLPHDDTPRYNATELIDPDEIIELTDMMEADGSMNWRAPKGRWCVMRIASVPTGARIKHMQRDVAGLECDKLSKAAIIHHWNNYCGVVLDTLDRIGCPAAGVCMDSHEGGSQNWTQGFDREFAQRRGYPLTPYLPAMLGYIVRSAKFTSELLSDVRTTISDLVADNYFGTLDSLCRDRGIPLTAQAMGNGLTMVVDNIRAKGRVSKPQGEFWAYQTYGAYDAKECSSAAHLYGKQIASQEAFTDARFDRSLYDLRLVADMAYAMGSNEFAICAIAAQPWMPDTVPGNTAGGRCYSLTRTNTLWPYARPFFDYQARCSALLRQGAPVVDICVLMGDGAPLKLLSHRLPAIPCGFDFDAATADALMTRMSVRDGSIMLPDGHCYRAIALAKDATLSASVRSKLEQFSSEGATVCEYDQIGPAIASQGIAPDVWFDSRSPGFTARERVFFCHRRLRDADVYMLVNRTPGDRLTDTVRLRTPYSQLELWNPLTGKRYRLPASRDGSQLCAPIRMEECEAFFLVALDSCNNLPLPDYCMQDTGMTAIDGPWAVRFHPVPGDSIVATFDSLTDWAKHPDPDIRYYSGTATYHKQFELPECQLDGNDTSYWLQFTHIADVAKVTVNGQEAGIIWCPPMEIDISPFVRTGTNVVEVQVANKLINRMVGDLALPQSQRTSYCTHPAVDDNTPLLPSGLIGEVRLLMRDCESK